METKEIPILLLTGYLGSGKTTLLNYLLSNREGIKFASIYAPPVHNECKWSCHGPTHS